MKRITVNALGVVLTLSLLIGLPASVFSAALSADRNTQIKVSMELKAYPVKATTVIYKGGMVCLNTSGYALPCADAASYVVVGIADEQADNDPGAAGAINVRVRTGFAKMNASSITQAMVGTIMYVVDDNTVDDGKGTNAVAAGVLVEYVSSTSGWVSFAGPIQNPSVNNLMAGVGAGYRIARGTVTLDGSNPTEFSHGLTTVVACQLTDVRSDAAGLDPVHFTYTVVAGTINLYAWKYTHSSNPTLIASTDADDVIAWSCTGT